MIKAAGSSSFRPLIPPDPSEKATQERFLALRWWNERVVSFRTTRSATFRFEPGQYVRLGLASSRGGIIWRPYSMASAAHDAHLEFLSILIPDGAFSKRLALAQVGDPIHVEKTASGFLTPGRFSDGQDLWLLATGTGLAPFLSILQAPDVWQRYRRLILAHSVRKESDLAYRQEIPDLARHPLWAEHGHKFSYLPIVTRATPPAPLNQRLPQLIRNGTLETAAGTRLSPTDSRILLCGNPAMLDAVGEALTERGLRHDRSQNPGHFASENYW